MAQVSSSIAWNISTWVTTALAQYIYWPLTPLFCVFNTILCQKWTFTVVAFIGSTTVFLPLPSIPQAFFKIFLILSIHYINIKFFNPHWEAFHFFSFCITPKVFSYFLLFSASVFLLVCILFRATFL